MIYVYWGQQSKHAGTCVDDEDQLSCSDSYKMTRVVTNAAALRFKSAVLSNLCECTLLLFSPHFPLGLLEGEKNVYACGPFRPPVSGLAGKMAGENWQLFLLWSFKITIISVLLGMEAGPLWRDGGGGGGVWVGGGKHLAFFSIMLYTWSWYFTTLCVGHLREAC